MGESESHWARPEKRAELLRVQLKWKVKVKVYCGGRAVKKWIKIPVVFTGDKLINWNAAQFTAGSELMAEFWSFSQDGVRESAGGSDEGG